METFEEYENKQIVESSNVTCDCGYKWKNREAAKTLMLITTLSAAGKGEDIRRTDDLTGKMTHVE